MGFVVSSWTRAENCGVPGVWSDPSSVRVWVKNCSTVRAVGAAGVGTGVGGGTSFGASVGGAVVTGGIRIGGRVDGGITPFGAGVGGSCSGGNVVGIISIGA